METEIRGQSGPVKASSALLLPNVQDEPRPRLARAVLLGARIVTAVVVGSGALLGFSVLRLMNDLPCLTICS
jgi:hypothetical protein